MSAGGEAHTTAERLARAYLDALQRKDQDAIVALLTDDVVFEVPLNLSGNHDPDAPDQRNHYGIEKAAANFERAFREIVDLKLVDLEFSPSPDGTVVFAEAAGDMHCATGRPYKNRYVFRFDVDDGKIRRIREYVNPLTSAVAFGRPFPWS